MGATVRAWLSGLLLVFGLWGSAHAEERITYFFSDVVVQADGDLIVTESIRVIAQGNEIKRGLLRDFPTTYKRADGTAIKVGFDVLDVRRDDRAEPYKLEYLDNGVRIRMGSADVLLSEGQHEYVIRYRTTRQIGFFPDVDELYWNATGTGWSFPIDQARARLTLPQPSEILKTAVYTGAMGSRDTNARVVERRPGQIVFETTEPLGDHEGLTVAASWPKGIVSPPSMARIWIDWIHANTGTVVAVVGFLLLAAYYLAVAAKTRRRSHPMIVPLYEPPEGMSSPAVRYVSRQAYDQRTFVVGMLELIGLRQMRMVKKSEDMTFELTGGRVGDSRPLDSLLARVLHKLFRKDKSFVRDGLEGTRFEDAETLLEKSLDKQYGGKLFDTHRPQALRGRNLWLIYLAACLAALWFQNPAMSRFVFMCMPFCIPAIWGWTAVYGAWRKNGFNLGWFLFALLFLGPMLLGGLSVLFMLAGSFGVGVLAGALPLLLLPVVIRAFHFLKGYTEPGYRVMDQIAGFKRYLTVAEGPRLQALVTPAEKLEVYEKCLPYAVALDVGKEWAAAFSGLFAGVAGMAALDAMQQYYGGHDLMREDPMRTVREIARDVSPSPSSAAASSSAPGTSSSYSGSSSSSSSSGSSGGGSSGGGGGGGGGSGW